MKIEEALLFFEGLKTKNSSKKELNIYSGFITVLKDLKSRALTDENIQAIENELTTLKIKENIKDIKVLAKKKCSFIAFVKQELSLIAEGHHFSLYMSIGMSMGMIIGMILGIAFNKSKGMVLGMNFGMIIGIALGMAIGISKDNEAKKSGRVLSTKG